MPEFVNTVYNRINSSENRFALAGFIAASLFLFLGSAILNILTTESQEGFTYTLIKPKEDEHFYLRSFNQVDWVVPLLRKTLISIAGYHWADVVVVSYRVFIGIAIGTGMFLLFQSESNNVHKNAKRTPSLLH